MDRAAEPSTTVGTVQHGRVLALLALLLVAGAATQGHVPGVVGEPRQSSEASPAEMITLAVLLAVSMGAVAVAAANRLRHPRAAAGSMGQLVESPSGSPGRPSWRVLLIGLAAVALPLAAIVVFAELGGIGPFSIPEPPDPQGGVPVSPSSPVTPSPPTPHSAPSPDGSIVDLLVFSAIATVLLAVLAVTARSRRGRVRSSVVDGVAVAVPGPTEGEALARVAELGLTRITDRSRGPREAIIACYAAMERHLADVPDVAPRECDTPTEVLARAVEHHALAADNASRLVELFTEARFSPHQMTERDRADAVAILRLVLDELRSVT